MGETRYFTAAATVGAAEKRDCQEGSNWVCQYRPTEKSPRPNRTMDMNENKRTSGSFRIGVVSDTHGLLRPEAAAALSGVDLILHAGDIDVPQVLEKLSQIAPVRAVCGNMDFGPLRETLPESEVVEAGDHLLYMLHDLGRLDLDPEAAGFSAVIFGHSHRPSLEQRGKVLLLNPGSAGPKRFGKPVSVARIDIANGRLSGRVIELDV